MPSLSSSMASEISSFSSSLASEKTKRAETLLSMLPLIETWCHENECEWRTALSTHLDLALIIDCMFGETRVNEAANRVVRALANFVGPVIFVRQCHERLTNLLSASDQGLNASKSCVLKSIITECIRVDHSFLLQHQKLLEATIACLRDDELEVAHEAMKMLIEASRTKESRRDESNEFCLLFLPPILPLLHSLVKDRSAIIRMRLFDVIVNAVSKRPSLIKMADSEGFLGPLCKEMEGDDVLIQLNALELLSQLAAINEGLCFLEQNSILDKLALFFAQVNYEDAMATLLLPGYIKLFGCVSRLHGEDCLEKFPHFGHFITSCLESRNEFTPKVIETLAHICAKQEKKLELQKSHRSIIEGTTRILSSQLQQGSQEVRVEALNLTAQFVSSPTDQAQYSNAVENFNESFVRALKNDFFALLLHVARQPFVDVSCAALAVMEVLSKQTWGAKEIVLEPDLLEFLLDRNVLSKKEALELRFEIVRNVHEITQSNEWVSDSNKQRMEEFVKQGPYGGTANLEVAIEEA